MARRLAGAVLAACAPPAGEATLELTSAPTALDALGRTAQLRVVATGADWTPSGAAGRRSTR